MFGHDKQDGEDNSVPVSVGTSSTDDSTTTTPPPANPQDELNLPAPTVDDNSDDQNVGAPEFIETPVENMPEPSEPEHSDDHEEAAEPEMAEAEPEPEMADAEPAAAETYEPVPDAELSSEVVDESADNSSNDLSALRQQALHELSPLIGHLDQTPEEKYETAKKIYEETKDKSMLTTIYEAAKNLPDNKAKAQAIYDVVQKIDAAN